MENRINIVNELMELSPVLAQTQPNMPYRVPEGYFDQLPEKILALSRTSQETPALLNQGKQTPYSIPQGYFENLADTVLGKIKTIEAGSPKDEIETLSPLLSKLTKKATYNVPADYFDELAGNVTDGAKAIELVNEALENLSPVMSSLKAKNVYEIPQGYFDSLAVDILNKAKQQAPAKVVSISFRRKLIRYAAAAIVAGLVITAGWFYFNNLPAKNNAGEDIVEKETTKEVKTLGDDELLRFIETENNSIDETAATTANSEEIEATDIKDLLADVSDEELQKYVEEITPENNSSVTN